MEIDIDTIILNPKVDIDTNHKWGYEVRAIDTEKYCGKLLVYNTAEHKSSLHYHKIKDESFFCLFGKVRVELMGQGAYILSPGGSVHVGCDVRHRMQSLVGKSVLMEVSTYHSDDDTYRVEESV